MTAKRIHIQSDSVWLERVDAWAERHSLDRSSAIRALTAMAMERDARVSALGEALDVTLGELRRQIGMPAGTIKPCCPAHTVAVGKGHLDVCCDGCPGKGA